MLDYPGGKEGNSLALLTLPPPQPLCIAREKEVHTVFNLFGIIYCTVENSFLLVRWLDLSSYFSIVLILNFSFCSPSSQLLPISWAPSTTNQWFWSQFLTNLLRRLTEFWHFQLKLINRKFLVKVILFVCYSLSSTVQYLQVYTNLVYISKKLQSNLDISNSHTVYWGLSAGPVKHNVNVIYILSVLYSDTVQYIKAVFQSLSSRSPFNG